MLSGPAPGGVFRMENGRPPVPVVTHWGRRPFNSPQQIAVEPAPRPDQHQQRSQESDGREDGGQGDFLWFTDSTAGFEAEIRGRPQLPCHVYRYKTATGVLRVMADGLVRPGGIALSPDGGTLYVSDTAAQRVGQAEDITRYVYVYSHSSI
jgi:gluconolactonase